MYIIPYVPIYHFFISIDLVQTQIKVAEGKTLSEIGLSQDNIHTNG